MLLKLVIVILLRNLVSGQPCFEKVGIVSTDFQVETEANLLFNCLILKIDDGKLLNLGQNNQTRPVGSYLLRKRFEDEHGHHRDDILYSIYMSLAGSMIGFV